MIPASPRAACEKWAVAADRVVQAATNVGSTGTGASNDAPEADMLHMS